MSITHLSKKVPAKQHLFTAISPSNSVILDNLWFSGDSCAPDDLPIAELNARLTVHVHELSQLSPSSQEYDKQVAFAKMYQMILMLRGA